MNLVNVQTGEKISGRIERIAKKELKKMKGSKDFLFDWSQEIPNEVYAIKRTVGNEMLGLISLTDVAEELRIHINLIESAIQYQGKKKAVDGIPGCLIGFACEMSFKRGYDGFVSLTPKTKLVEYYYKKFGFIKTGRNMAVFLELSQSIIKQYLRHG